MAYFLPSYFQKRLLRYALTRLDFIETDALNLEDLDITFGQRSVVELKNVGIKAAKLMEKLQLPSTLVLDHALIRKLRVMVPADLHASGIVVEVDGVDIEIVIQEDHASRTQTGLAPSHKDVANRPRLTTTPLHDAHGKSPRRGASKHDLGHVIPTSQDLAMSFLDTEAPQEKEELEAAIQSQSHYMQESTASLASSANESGTGMPGGFSLPGFVANFFAGIADRLSVSVGNVEMVAGLHLPADGSPAETVKVMIRLEGLYLGPLNTTSEASAQTDSRRHIWLSGFEVMLLSEPEAFSQHSTASSPRLTRSRSKASSTFGSENMSQLESPESKCSDIEFHPTMLTDVEQSLPRLDRTSSNTSSSSSSKLADLRPNIGDSFLANSQLLQHSDRNLARTDYPRNPQTEAFTSSIDNREYAEQFLGSDDLSLSSPSTPGGHSSQKEDLTESRLFTHDQAESLYMSAISTGPEPSSMPGAWTTSDDSIIEQQARPSIIEYERATSVQSDSHLTEDVSDPQESRANVQSQPEIQKDMANSESQESRDHVRRTMQLSNLIAKRLVSVDKLTLSIPASKIIEPDDSGPQRAPTTNYTATSQKNLRADGRPGTASRNEVNDVAASYLMQSSHVRASSRTFVVTPTSPQYEIAIGELTLAIDMSIGRILLKATSALGKIFAAEKNQEKDQTSKTAAFSASTAIKSLQVHVCQSVPETIRDSENVGISATSTHDPVAAASILCLSLSGIQHEISQSQTDVRQKVVIEKIVLGQGTEKALYFVDSMNVRDSVTTSMLIRPHDLVITNVNDRFEVQLKPLHLVIDLLLVDDVLSRGGGLSSLMDLGNSVLSTGTIREKQQKLQTAAPRSRTVRFDSHAPVQDVNPEITSSGPKIDVRISGAFVNLIGSETSVQLKTSAIKLVSRQKTFRAQIDNVALLGPLVHGSRTSADINVKLANISLVYVDTPAEDDLDRLLSLLTPSSDKYDEEDDIMVDTLIRQRRKGGVMRLSTADVQIAIKGTAWHKHVSKLGDELSKLSAVSKYLPEDDRPGVLTFGLINKLSLKADLGSKFGTLKLKSSLLEGAHISIPGLVAAQLSTLAVERDDDILISEVIPNLQDTTIMGPPMLMCRFVADEMEPTVRVKLSNTQVEYTVPTLIAVIELSESLKIEKTGMESSPSPKSSEMSSSPSDASDFARKVRFSLAIRNSSIALNPDKSPAKGLLLLTDVGFSYGNKTHVSTAQLDLRKASILIIDDAGKIGHGLENADHKLYFEENDQVQELTKAGYVPVGSISNASAIVKIIEDKSAVKPFVDVEFRNNLFLLETCADSTQTLIQILSGLAPPTPPSTQTQYRTEIIPIQDMLASFTGNAFVTEKGPELGMQASQVTSTTSTSTADEEDYEDYDDDEDDSEEVVHVGSHRRRDEIDEDYHDDLADSYMDSELSHSTISGSVHVAPVNLTASDNSAMGDSVMAHSMLDFRTDHFARNASVGGTAHKWDSTQNAYGHDNEKIVHESPLKVRVRDMHIIWNLFDGYDWQRTRDTISQAVQEIETKATSKQSRRDARSPGGDDDESVIGDFLFNSIYIGIPATKDPRDLRTAINHDIGDLASETGSYATGTTVTAVHNNRPSSVRPKQKKLRLNRSRQHKLTFELRGVSADVLVFPPGSGEVETSVDVRVNMLEIFDHVPTSTWKKFATYMHEAGEREVNTNMVHIELLSVRPVADLAASELVLKLTVLPLRLHVDQDALDFMTRFFEFKDDKAPVSDTPGTPPFFQRVEVNPIQLKLDFKPKRVDYGGLRSGRTTEFMNFFVLDRADMVLRRVILYGVSGLDRVGIMLNNIWSPDVRRNQLPGVLAGLAPIRSLVDVGSGVRDLIAVPIREYKKDGRIVRSIQKGALAFAKTTTTELVNLGAKLAIGTQTVLQSAEDMLVPRQQDDDDDEVKRQISLYADQPLGIVQGLRGAYASLERDLLLAKDAIVAVPGEVMASGSATGAAKAILRQSPTIILRPAIGATKAVGQTLLGAGNTLDRKNLRRIEEKYKRHF